MNIDQPMKILLRILVAPISLFFFVLLFVPVVLSAVFGRTKEDDPEAQAVLAHKLRELQSRP